MAIKLQQDGVMGQARKYQIAVSTTVVANTLGTFTSGYLTPATSSTAAPRVLILESYVSGGSDHKEILCVDLNEQHTLLCDTAGNTSQALVGTKVDLTDAATVNQAATTTKVMYVVGIVGAAADKQILGKIVSKDA